MSLSKIKADENAIKVGDTIIFSCSEYNNGEFSEFDGTVLFVDKESVDVIYLSGYRSRNDSVKYKDIIAKVDISMPYIKLENAPYSGHFIVFDKKDN